MSASSLVMRRMIRRRSTSSLVSPLPNRAPTPPRCCDSLAVAPAESRQAVAQQRQLDLRLALERVGVLPEDVEDHRRAVDRGAAEQLLEVVLLGGRQLVVEHDGVGIDAEADLAQLLGLALADEPRVVRRGRVAARGAPLRRRRPCRRGAPARRGSPRSVSSVVPGSVTPTITMRSLTERSMRELPRASLYGVLT